MKKLLIAAILTAFGMVFADGPVQLIDMKTGTSEQKLLIGVPKIGPSSSVTVSNLTATGTVILPSPFYMGEIYSGNIYASNSITLNGTSLATVTGSNIGTNAAAFWSVLEPVAAVALVTNPVVQTVSEGTADNVISGAGVQAAITGDIAAESFESSNIGSTLNIGMFGQSKTVYTAEGTNSMSALSGEQLTGITNTFQIYQTASLDQYITQTNITVVTNTGTWSIEMQMAPRLRDHFSKDVYITKGGVSGAAISTLLSGGVNNLVITNSINRMNTIFPAAGSLDAVVWMQGETDLITYALATNYYSQLVTMFAQIRALPTVKKNTPIFINDIPYSGSDGVYSEYIRKAFWDIAKEDPFVIVVTNAGIAVSSDLVHYNGAGQVALGNRFADELIKYFSTSGVVKAGSAYAAKTSGKSVWANDFYLNGFDMDRLLTPLSDYGLNAYIPMRGAFTDLSTNSAIHTNVLVGGGVTWTNDINGAYVKHSTTNAAYIYNMGWMTNSTFSVSVALSRDFGFSAGQTYTYNIGSALILRAQGNSATAPETQFQPALYIKSATGTAVGYRSGIILPTNEFVRVGLTVVRNGTNSTIKFYKNGEPAYSVSPASDYSSSMGGGTGILGFSNTDPTLLYLGGMRDFVVYDRALSDDEWKALHTQQMFNRSGVRGIQ